MIWPVQRHFTSFELGYELQQDGAVLYIEDHL
jgi:hypothetical protein